MLDSIHSTTNNNNRILWILTTFEDIHDCTTGSQLQQKEIVMSTKDDFYFPFANVLKNYGLVLVYINYTNQVLFQISMLLLQLINKVSLLSYVNI